MPASAQARRSSSKALAVMARIGTVFLCASGADGAGRLEAVHVRHLHVHQDQVVGGGASLVEGLAAIDGDIDGQLRAVQQVERDLAVDRVVFGQQQAGAAMVQAQRGFGILRRRSDGGGHRSPAAFAGGR
jgi:hypothetical protein